MVASCWYVGDLGGYGITMAIMHGKIRTLLSIVRLYGMNVTHSLALDMNESPHLTTG